VLKHCAANRKRQLSALPNVGPYIYSIYTTLKFLALQGAPYISDTNRLRVNYCLLYTDITEYVPLNIDCMAGDCGSV
jgi:hypothetical protein